MSDEQYGIENLSLNQLQNLGVNIPGLSDFVARILVKTYDEFVGVLYQDIDKIIHRLQGNAELHQRSEEDLLTICIRDQLIAFGYQASHDTKFGGHVDLLVQKDSFTWIGEAKIHRDYGWLLKGFLQLTTRYSTGDTNQTSGGLIIYIKGHDAKKVMGDWQNHLALKNFEDYASYDCPKRQGLAFFSEHRHEGSGLMFHVRHIPVLLYFNPKDR
jgi:hypothetical protein